MRYKQTLTSETQKVVKKIITKPVVQQKQIQKPVPIQKQKQAVKPSGNVEKAIIFDSGALISFSMNGITDLIRSLRGIFNGKFIITQDVKKEIIDKPISVKKFELEALKIKQLFDEKILELPSALGIEDKDIEQKTNLFMERANNVFHGPKSPVKLLDLGESSCLALSSILNEKGIKNVIAVDERTLRSLVEDPNNLRKYLEKKMHIKITTKSENLKFFQNFKIIRSPELVYVAYKKGLVKITSNEKGLVLDALLYAVKFKGASISREEIEEINRLG